MAERFFASPIGTDDTVRFTGDEAHHLARVRRIGLGERVRLFDGSGYEFEAVVEHVGKREVLLSIVAREAIDRELPFSLTLGCAPPKGDRLRWLVEKATELGVTRFVPLLTEHATPQSRAVTAERTRRWVIEASKQCGRNVLMQVSDAMRWTEYLDSAHRGVRIVAHSTGASAAVCERGMLADGVALAVGPEGNFTAAELELARARGWQTVCLGTRTLRVETAALVLVARVTAELAP